MKAILMVMVLLASAALMGCTGTDTGDSPDAGGDDSVTDGGDIGIGDTGVDEWCVAGTQWSYAGTAEGEMSAMNYEIKGFTTYDGEQMCHAVTTMTQGGQNTQIDYYFDQDEDKVCYEMKDLDTGTELFSGCVSGGA